MPEGANTSSGILRLCKLHRLSKHGKAHTPDGAHTRPCVALTPTEGGRSVHFPPYSGTAAVSERHLRPAGSGRTCSPRSPGAQAFVVLVSGHPSRGVGARRSTKWRLGGGARAGRPGAVSIPDSRQGAPSALRRKRTARRAFPRFLRRAPGHKGLEGKHGARSHLRSGWRAGAAWSGPQGRSRTRRNRALGRGVGRGAALLPLPSPALNSRKGLAGRGGRAGRRRHARGRCRRGAGREPPFSLARRNGGSWVPFPKSGRRARLRERPRPSPQIVSSVRAF